MATYSFDTEFRLGVMEKTVYIVPVELEAVEHLYDRMNAVEDECDLNALVSQFVAVVGDAVKGDDDARVVISPPRHCCRSVEEALIQEGITPIYWAGSIRGGWRLVQPPLDFEGGKPV